MYATPSEISEITDAPHAISDRFRSNDLYTSDTLERALRKLIEMSRQSTVSIDDLAWAIKKPNCISRVDTESLFKMHFKPSNPAVDIGDLL